jgi:ribonuclease Z
MSNRELIALGTSSQSPTRERSHNAYVLRWDGEGYLFDPGEGAQRQLTLANISACSIHSICITHFHGDHCLGLAGILQRLSADRCDHPIHLYYPESGQLYVERLCGAAIYQSSIELKYHPIKPASPEMLDLHHTSGCTLKSFSLDHSVPTVGYRLEESPGLRFQRERLERMGIVGPMVGELQRKGWIDIAGRIARIEEVTEPRQGSVFAFVMDTRRCPGAIALAKNANLLVMEATYTSEHQDLADRYLHCTSSDAAKVALAANAKKLALGHFSQRYVDTRQHLEDALAIFPNVIVLNDLDRVGIPRQS